ncbi:MAG: oxidoreductase [Acidobacteriaceae bacterium]|nr:oxidoreductase [Acidobacteriaceae bacterium]
MTTETQKPIYTRNHPFQSTVLVNRLMTLPASEKETRHFELSLDVPEMQYTPGDAVGIIPENRSEAVAEVLAALGFTGNERVKDHYGVDIDLEEALRTRLSIGKLTKSSVAHFVKATGHQTLAPLLESGNKAELDTYLWGREFIDLALECPGAIADPQELFKAVGRLTPRMYSIASSQRVHPDSVHTIVRVIRYDTYQRSRQGVCSGHLGDRASDGTTIPIFLHSNNAFRLPADTAAPVIMIGPGTGIAPFRAFLEEREATAQTGQNWLFFGEQRSPTDFLYKDDLLRMQAEGVLTQLSTAFSRDQSQKIYVQDRMRENARELYAWLERGAYFYVCGDAERMAVDVEKALLDIIAAESGRGAEHAAEYLAQLKQQKRYLRDVY